MTVYEKIVSCLFCFKNGATPASFHLFSSFQTHIQILQQIGMWKNVHPVYSTGIQTNDLSTIDSSHNH